MMAPTYSFSWLEPERLVCCLAHRSSNGVFLLLRILIRLLGAKGFFIVGQLTESASLRFLFVMVVILSYVFVLDDLLTS